MPAVKTYTVSAFPQYGSALRTTGGILLRYGNPRTALRCGIPWLSCQTLDGITSTIVAFIIMAEIRPGTSRSMAKRGRLTQLPQRVFPYHPRSTSLLVMVQTQSLRSATPAPLCSHKILGERGQRCSMLEEN